MEGDQVSRSLPKGLVKRVVLRAVRFRKIWAERKSWPAGRFSTSSQGHKEVEILPGDVHNDELYAEGAEVVSTEAEEEMSNMSLSDDRLKSLPEELVERIMAMVPFPEVCKARVLSKSWQARFSPIESHGDEEKKRRAILFQKQVRLQSINWTPPCPFFFDLSEQLFYAYSSASHDRTKLPSLSFLPRAVLNDIVPKTNMYYPDYALWAPVVLNRDYRPHFKCLELIDGALLFSATVIRGQVTQSSKVYCPLKLRVANLLTQTWRQLPQAPREREDIPFVELVSQPALEKYKVIVFNCGLSGNFFAQCYDSKSNSWRRTTTIQASRLDGSTRPAHLDGVLYIIGKYDWTRLLAFNVEEETFEELELIGVGSWLNHKINLVVCNSNLLMTVQDNNSPRTVQVLKIGLESREVSEVARGPPDALTVGRCTRLQTESSVSDGVTSICFRLFGTKVSEDAMVVYNMRIDAWHYVALSGIQSWIKSSFQTNCNPFLAV